MTTVEHIKVDTCNHQKEQDKLYPDRHKVIHKVPCQHCPSANHDPDPESQDIKDNCSKEYIAKEMLFVCDGGQVSYVKDYVTLWKLIRNIWTL